MKNCWIYIAVTICNCRDTTTADNSNDVEVVFQLNDNTWYDDFIAKETDLLNNKQQTPLALTTEHLPPFKPKPFRPTTSMPFITTTSNIKKQPPKKKKPVTESFQAVSKQELSNQYFKKHTTESYLVMKPEFTIDEKDTHWYSLKHKPDVDIYLNDDDRDKDKKHVDIHMDDYDRSNDNKHVDIHMDDYDRSNDNKHVDIHMDDEDTVDVGDDDIRDEYEVDSESHEVTSSYPLKHQVNILDGSQRYCCPGTVVHERWVITAANYFTGRRNIRGYSVVPSSGHSRRHTANYIERIVMHRDYKETAERYIEHNLAMLRLSHSVTDNNNVQIIKIFDSAKLPKELPVSVVYRVRQSGVTVKQLPSKKIPGRICSKMIGQKTGITRICVNATKDICSAELGSPLLFGEELLGLRTAVNLNDHLCSNPMMYTSLPAYADWIDECVYFVK